MKAFPTGTGGGMDLLDYFAAQAMKAFVAKEPNTTDPKIAEWAYNQGLAMIKLKKNIITMELTNKFKLPETIINVIKRPYLLQG